MKEKAIRRSVLLMGGLLSGFIPAAGGGPAQSLPNLLPLRNPSGFVETYNINDAPIDLTGAFFQSLGTNGRSCSSCHRPADGWSMFTSAPPRSM